MYQLIVPHILNDNSFEYFLNQIPPLEEVNKKNVLIDLSLTKFIDNYGLLGILAVGIFLKRKKIHTYLKLPRDKNLNKFIDAVDFFRYADLGFNELFNDSDRSTLKLSKEIGINHNVVEKESNINFNIILKITPIREVSEVCNIISSIRKNIQDKITPKSEGIWSDILTIVSEMCQNVPEHSQDSGFVLITQSFDELQKKDIIQIAVIDLGIGIKNSLDKKFYPIFREKWSDQLAIHKVLFEGASRYDKLGRGNGIIQTRELVYKHKGKMFVRSGRAKLWGKYPTWEFEKFFRKPLTYLSGTQIKIIVPL